MRASWTLGVLGIGGNPPPPGGMVFSANGSTLYLAVAPTQAGTSTLYAVPVTRNGAGRATALGTAAAVLSLNDSTSGFDGGLAFGSGGNLLFAQLPPMPVTY